jgi:cytochrome P450
MEVNLIMFFPDSELVIPKGTPVYIPIYGFHMDPKHWEEPEKFRPERFALENKDKIVKGAFCPFGQGPRMCLGMNFIRMEGRAYLANLIRLYKIQPSDKTIKNLDWELEGSGRIKGGVWIKLVRRDS